MAKIQPYVLYLYTTPDRGTVSVVQFSPLEEGAVIREETVIIAGQFRRSLVSENTVTAREARKVYRRLAGQGYRLIYSPIDDFLADLQKPDQGE